MSILKESIVAFRKNKSAIFWLSAGYLFFLACISILEIQQNLYFTKDDNYASGMPILLNAFRCIWDEGIIPTLNQYQMMGLQIEASLGLLYPLNYLCYFISRNILGNELYLMETYAVVHLTICYLAFYFLCRTLKVRPSLSVMSSLFYTLSGYSLIVMRSWFWSGVIAFAPLLLALLMLIYQEGRNTKYIICFGIITGVLLNNCNSQMNLYCLMLIALAALLMVIFRQVPFKKSLLIIPAILLGLGIGFPTLLTQFDILGKINRVKLTYGDWNALIFPALFLPYPFDEFHKTYDPFLFTHMRGQLFFAGSLNALWVLILSPFYAIAGFIGNKISFREIFKSKQSILIILSLLSLALSLGDEGIAWKVLHSLPVLNKFRGSFKLFMFFNLFSLASLAIALEGMASSPAVKKTYKTIFVFFSLSIIIYSMFISKYNFCNYSVNFYPEKSAYYEKLLDSKDNFRIYPLAPQRSLNETFFLSMNLYFPSYYNIHSLIGYDDKMLYRTKENKKMLGNLSRDFTGSLKAYGVRYVLLYTNMRSSGMFPYDYEKFKTIVKSKFPRVYETHDVEYYELPLPDPLSFVYGHAEKRLPVVFNAQGAIVDISTLRERSRIVINMLLRPNMSAFDENNRKVNLSADEWGRIVAEIRPGSKTITVQYMPQWRIGMFLGLFIITAAIALLALYKKYIERAGLDKPEILKISTIKTVVNILDGFIIRKPYLIIAFIVYCVCLIVVVQRHEPWADEAQAWLIARDSSLPDLILHVIKYEGSPSLWHMLLMIPVGLGVSYKYINLFSASFAVIGVYFFLRYSPFHPVIKVLLPFTYFLFFQYAVVARSYVLIPPLLFILASFYKTWESKIIIFTILAGLLGNVSFHAAVFSVFIFLHCGINIIKKWGAFKKNEKINFIISCVIYGIMMLFALYQMIPAADVYFAREYSYTLIEKIDIAARIFSDAFITNYATGDITPWMVFFNILLLVVLTVLILYWFYQSKVLLLFLMPTICLLLFFTIKYYNVWHQGLIFVYFIFVLWISYIHKWDNPQKIVIPINGAIRKSVSGLFPDRDILNRIIVGCVIVIALIQISWSVKTFEYDYYNNYSGSWKTAEFIRQDNLDYLKIAGVGFKSTALQPYFNRNIFMNINPGSPKGYWVWSLRKNYKIGIRGGRWKWYSKNHHYVDINSLVGRDPDIIIVGFAKKNVTEIPPIEGFTIISRFNGNLFWKEKPYESEDFVIYKRNDL